MEKSIVSSKIWYTGGIECDFYGGDYSINQSFYTGGWNFIFVTFSAIFRLVMARCNWWRKLEYPTRKKTLPNSKSLATFSHGPAGIGTRTVVKDSEQSTAIR